VVINPGDVWIIEEPNSRDTTSLDNGNPLALRRHAHEQFRH
jgi:hypothetical protein